MRILIVDDHQNMIDALKNIIPYAFEEAKNINFIESLNCKSAFLEIKKEYESNNSFDLAIIDYSLPADTENKVSNGGDLCLFVREKMPSCKTMIFTAHLEDFLLFEINQKIKPDALVIKSEVGAEGLIKIFEGIFEGKKYSSSFVLEKANKMWTEDIFTQETNRKIVELISKGYKIKEIADELSLSEAAIQKRIAKIKKGLNITDDKSILREVKRRGYL